MEKISSNQLISMQAPGYRYFGASRSKPDYLVTVIRSWLLLENCNLRIWNYMHQNDIIVGFAINIHVNLHSLSLQMMSFPPKIKNFVKSMAFYS